MKRFKAEYKATPIATFEHMIEAENRKEAADIAQDHFTKLFSKTTNVVTKKDIKLTEVKNNGIIKAEENRDEED